MNSKPTYTAIEICPILNMKYSSVIHLLRINKIKKEDNKYVITDTYPDKDGFQHLILYNVEKKKGAVLAKFYAYDKGQPASCDLHPKLAINNNYVVVDTAYDERHHMMVFVIKSL